jgi:hypothetical protein
VPVHQDRVGGDLGECWYLLDVLPSPGVGWRLDGVRYESEDAYRAALRKRDERRARWMAALERDGFLFGERG